MSKHSYHRNKGGSTGELWSEGKIDIMDLPERVPLRFREEEDEDDDFGGLTEEEYKAFLKAQDEIWEASQNPPEPKELEYDEF